MGDITLWIVLGSLIGLVVLFLLGYTIFDRIKRKKIIKEEKLLAGETEDAAKKVVLYMNMLIDKNELILKEFVPSIGKLKMSDIKRKAVEGIKALKDSQEYKLLLDEDVYEPLIQSINELQGQNSNMWATGGLTNFFRQEKESLKDTTFPDYTTQVEADLTKLYSWTRPTN